MGILEKILGKEKTETKKESKKANDDANTVLHQLDQKIIYPHYDFKHLTEKYFEIGMKLDDFLIQLVKYWNREKMRIPAPVKTSVFDKVRSQKEQSAKKAPKVKAERASQKAAQKSAQKTAQKTVKRR